MTSNTLGIGGVHRCGTWASIGNGIVDFHQCGAWPASASVRHRRRPSMRHVGQHRYRHRRLPSMRRVASIGIGAASAAFINAARGPASVSASSASINAARGQHRHRCGIADNRSGCIRRQQVWMCSPATGLDVFADHRSGCIRRRQVWMYSPTAGHAATAAPGAGRRGRQGPNPRERRIEVTRARDPLPGPRHTSPPLTLVCVDARRPPRLTPRVTRGHMQGSTGAPGAYPRARARAQCRDHPRPLSVPGAAPHVATIHNRPRRRQGVATVHGRRAQRAGTSRAALERPARACMDFLTIPCHELCDEHVAKLKQCIDH